MRDMREDMGEDMGEDMVDMRDVREMREVISVISESFRTFKCSSVTADTLCQIYRRGLSLEFLSLKGCGIRSSSCAVYFLYN